MQPTVIPCPRQLQIGFLDITLVLLAADGDEIATSDPDDLKLLAQAAGRVIELLSI